MVEAEARPAKIREWVGIAEEEMVNVVDSFGKLGNKRRRNIGSKLKGMGKTEREVCFG